MMAAYGMSPLHRKNGVSDERIEVVVAPRAGDMIELVQQGIFTKAIGERWDLLSGFPREKLREEPFGRAWKRQLGHHFFVVRLPQDLAPRTVEVLRSQDIHAVTLFLVLDRSADLVPEVFLTTDRRMREDAVIDGGD